MSALVMVGIALAGGAGAALRFGVYRLIPAKHRSRYPWATTAVNLSGSLAIGFVVGLSTGERTDAWLMLIGIGLLGGYTTLSTASIDAMRLLLRRRFGAALLASFGLLVGSVVCAWVGLVLGSL